MALLLMAQALVGCGSPPPPKAPAREERVIEPPPSKAGEEGRQDDGMTLSGDGVLGSVDEDAVQRVMQPALERFGECFNKEKRFPYIGGTITLRYRIARDGSVKRLGFQSDVGAWEVERCVVAAASELRFPVPKGGEAEFEYPVVFRPKHRHKVWDSQRISADVHRQEGQLSMCAGAPSEFVLTFYIGAGGKTTSVGFSTTDRWGKGTEAFAECVVEKARGWRFTDPLGEITKASFSFGTP